jgi:hypothetical protein
MIGFLFVAAVLVFTAMLAMKLVPAYIEFFSVKKILATMGQDSSLRSKATTKSAAIFPGVPAPATSRWCKPSDLTIERSGGAGHR